MTQVEVNDYSAAGEVIGTKMLDLGKRFFNRAFEPQYNWSKKVDKEGKLVHPQQIKYRPVQSRGIYDCHARGLHTPGRAEEIAKQEAFKADLARQLEEAGVTDTVEIK
jgi:hypothetical protein